MVLVCVAGETEEDFATRLANNLENLILKEGPETVKSSCYPSLYYSTGPKYST